MSDSLHALHAELQRWGEDGNTARVWIRDDDAIRMTQALDQFLETLTRFRAPALIAAIPALIETSLATRLADEEAIAVAVHGWAHHNHAEAGMKAAEYPAGRDHAAMACELRDGLATITEMFPTQALPVFVPPWNRAYASVTGDLAALGYTALSTFADDHLNHTLPGLRVVNSDVDLMRWRGVRGGRPLAEVANELAAALAQSRVTDHRPVGLLTHHLVHDAVAQATLVALLDTLATHPSATWIGPGQVFSAALP